jgi:ribosomal protein L37AE/L43A/CRP-like cAMP-binding protein
VALAKDYSKTLGELGVELSVDGDQGRGDCPLCGKPNHLYVNIRTGQWDCKACQLSGNIITLMTKMVETAAKEMHPKDLDRLAKLRGLPTEAFKPWKVSYTGSEWWIPVFSETGTVRDIRRWNGKTLYLTKNCKTQLFNYPALLAASAGSQVWICEGEWDAIAMSWLLKKAGRTADIVVGVPGAGTFKDEWVFWFRGHHVNLVYDNDLAGERGMEKARMQLEKIPKTMKYIWWPESRPEGWDIRDEVKSGIGEKITAKDAVKNLELLLHGRLRFDPQPSSSLQKNGAASSEGKTSANEKPASFEDVMTVFRKWCFVDKGFENCVAVALATVMSDSIPGDPLWIYVVGAASSGKSIILTSLSGSDRVIFHSSLTPKSLVSGFNVHPDPSLLPTFDGKTAVFKDGTELLTAHPDARRETFGILRGAYDGRVDREYGNGVKRNYILHFGVLMGVTDAIHGEKNATVGERFLKYQLRDNPRHVDLKIRAAIENISKETEMEKELSDVVRRFLLRKITPATLPQIPPWAVDRIVGLAQIVGKLRAEVTRNNFERDELSFRPAAEIGIRVAKQLTKMARVLPVVFGHQNVDEKIFNIIRKLACDSAIGFHIDIVKLLSENQDGLTRNDIGDMCRIPYTTVSRRLDDLSHLGIVTKIQDPEENVTRYGSLLYCLTRQVQNLWSAGFAEVNGHASAPDIVLLTQTSKKAK